MVAYLDEVYKNNESLDESMCVSNQCLKKEDKSSCYNNAGFSLCAAPQSKYTYDPNKNQCVDGNTILPPCDIKFYPDHRQIARTMCPLCLYYEVNN